ncbi:hypothetical protein FisN_2Hu027 [Fistulifera solaris]|uniref:Uncharacterized protein n=1 Tax=Fistulifera solaris TaxID=1519565 RepID=A0A1Z5KEF2_FISSO|nr:hypothetical protein FisN_2Hu027 [Fistulifera solaris]|eukprot:GAX24482.1 hypothetical protein FisN_2Hu027 [Fistulifera solaris]
MTFFGQFELQDEGTAFVDALQQRTSPFGSLQFYGSPFGDQNLERLLQLENTFERLSPLGIDPKFNRLALSAKVNALDYKFCVKDFQPNDFDSLVISTKDLSVDLYIGKGDPWKEILIAFLNRLSILGHMEKFNLRTSCSDFGFNPKECVVPVVDALIRAVTANQKLSCLNLSSAYWVEEHLPNIVKALEDHEGIRHLFVFNYPVEKDSRGRTSCPSLTRLLERNPNIRVLDSCGNLITDGSNKMLLMYFRNFFYQDSLDFRKESNTVRPFLVASTLMGFASAQFPLIATLLSHHTDLLCDFMKGPSPDVAGGNNVTVARTSPQSTSHSKRKRTKQAPRATKKHTTLAGDA